MLYFKVQYSTHREFNTEIVHDLIYKTEWYKDPVVRDIVYSIDGSLITEDGLIIAKNWTYLSPIDLSTAVKDLILLYKVPEYSYNFQGVSAKEANIILKISKIQDIYINVDAPLDFLGVNRFKEYGDSILDAVCLNTGQQFHTQNEISECIEELMEIEREKYSAARENMDDDDDDDDD